MKLALWEPLQNFIERDTLTLGICNGCQIIANLGLAPAFSKNYGERLIAVTHNLTARYQCRWIDLKIQSSSPWLNGIETMHIPVAHGEGRFMMDSKTFQQLKDSDQIAAIYTKNGKPAEGEHPFNPNGSPEGITALTTTDGRVTIMMPHPERVTRTVQHSWHPDDWSKDGPWMRLFQNARQWVG